MTHPLARRIVSCRICARSSLAPVVDLGEMPLANSFVRDATVNEPRFPLAVVRCTDCGLLQLTVVVAPEVMFSDYLYSSSASEPMIQHFAEYADEVADRFAPSGSLVVEIGSNDGILLGPLQARGIHPLGVEPAKNLAAVANARGLETSNEFFTEQVAGRIRDTKGAASAVLANNVVAHIDDLQNLARGVDHLLADDGVFVMEVPHLAELIDSVEYDTVYHEHLSYFSLRPLARLFTDIGMELFDARRLPIHGGSLRVFVGRKGRHARGPDIANVEAREREVDLGSAETFARFARRVEASRTALREMIFRLRAAGSEIAALGATAKGNTLLNYCSLGVGEISWIGDSTPLKQGLLTPGSHIPIRPDSTILAEQPPYTLLLAWNYADSILRRFSAYTESGGRFIHPIPLARMLPP